jgi:hypothetical protein
VVSAATAISTAARSVAPDLVNRRALIGCLP